MKAVIWEPPARDEYDHALAVSRDAARFQRAVNDALQDIASGRIVHAQVARTRARRCALTSLPYSIIYTETADEVRVYALHHHSRRSGYWKHRLRRP